MEDVGTFETTREREHLQLVNALSTALADTFMLYHRYLTYHWNVRGSEFFELHELFEKGYGEMAEFTDELAERIRTLGEFPPSSLTEVKSLSLLEDEDALLDSGDMIRKLINAHEYITERMKTMASGVANMEDIGTFSLLSRHIERHEKKTWMLRSMIGHL